MIAKATLTIGGVTFTIGDEDVETPEGLGTIVGLDPFADEEIGVRLANEGEIRWYSWREVQL